MKSTNILPLSILTAALLMSGCASTRNYKKAESTSNSLETAALVINQCNAQVGVVTQTLNDLVESPSANIQPQFRKFDSELTKLKALAKNMNDQSAAIQTEGTDYFKSWDEDLAKINNEDIRSRSTERKHIMAVRFEKVRIKYEQAKGEIALFLSNLTDVRTVLSSDLTAGGLDSIEDATEDSEDKAKQIDKTQDAVKEAAMDLKTYTYERKSEFVAAMKKQVVALETNIKELSNMIDKSSDKVKAEAQPKLAALRQQSALLSKQVEAINDSTPTTWDGIKADTHKAYLSLKENFMEARQWVSDRIEP